MFCCNSNFMRIQQLAILPWILYGRKMMSHHQKYDLIVCKFHFSLIDNSLMSSTVNLSFYMYRDHPVFQMTQDSLVTTKSLVDLGKVAME